MCSCKGVPLSLFVCSKRDSVTSSTLELKQHPAERTAVSHAHSMGPHTRGGACDQVIVTRSSSVVA